ncbi:hypothetical protein LOTGIDRAFT_238058 [Lottia gigantea]|uniref:Uncharacterized protein n=1 Tax=Lottia gigantea TaxID=225164 RepID=V4CJ48_LOTGI|nr:hypothetical protein LOTGIDRAFT_238058 [Lottia gigantea]ESP02230.1 hypothetical protein LOTGIDRAFT_238058 [Lottia gigantea]
MNGQLLVLACAVLGSLAWAPREEVRPEVVYTAPQVVAAPQVIAPAPVVTQVVAPQPYAAHRHRFSGSLLLAKAKAVLNSDEVSGYAYPASAAVAVRPAVYAAPERFYHGARYLAGHGPAPVFAAPHASYPHNGGYLKYRLYNDLYNHHNDGDYHHSRVEQEDRERRQILALRAAEDDKRHHFEDYLRHEADEAIEQSKFREFGRFARLNNYIHRQEAQAEFGSLLGQLQQKRREHVFGLVFQVIKFCKCRDDIIDLHQYFSGADRSNRSLLQVVSEICDHFSSYGSYGNNQQNVFGDDPSQLFGQGGVIPIPRSPEQAKRWFMRGLVNTICDSSKFYVEKVKKLAAQQGFAGTFDAQYNQMQNGQYDNNNINNNNVPNNDNNNQNNFPANNNNNNNNQFRNNNGDNYNTNYNANTNDYNRNNNNNYYNNNSQ